MTVNAIYPAAPFSGKMEFAAQEMRRRIARRAAPGSYVMLSNLVGVQPLGCSVQGTS
jgi:hypothetical protein